jgi:hypothetical protein
MKVALKLLFGLGVVGLAAALWLWLRGDPFNAALRTRALATRGLAEHLAAKYPGERVLVISNPFAQREGFPPEVRAQEEAGLRGLREGFGTKVTLQAVALPELKPEAEANPRAVVIDAATTTPLSYLVAEDAFDKLAKAHPDCEILVSLIGLPAQLDRVELWRQPGRIKLALLLPDLRIVGDKAAVLNAVKSGKLAAFVLSKPGAPAEQERHGGDPAAEFERRFVLVTPENVERVFQAYPRLFE